MSKRPEDNVWVLTGKGSGRLIGEPASAKNVGMGVYEAGGSLAEDGMVAWADAGCKVSMNDEKNGIMLK